MTLKKFGIFTGIIAAIIVITTIVLSCIRVDCGLGLTPDKIIVYSESSVGVEYTEETTPSRYNKLNSLLNSSTNLSIIDYMFRGVSLNSKPSQDIDNEYSRWSENNKSNGYCVELIFNDKQTVIVSIDGDTKVVEFYGLIFMVEDSIASREVAIYFSTSEGSSKSYTTNPMLLNAKQNKLLSYLIEINEE